MNIEHLRRALKSEWLNYYRQNRHWIVRLGVWVNCQGQRRPSASFILGTLSTLEPQLVHLLPLVVDLNSNPDRIVLALGLNFNPEEELEGSSETELPAAPETKIKMLQSSTNAKVPAVELNNSVDTKEMQSSYVSNKAQSEPVQPQSIQPQAARPQPVQPQPVEPKVEPKPVEPKAEPKIVEPKPIQPDQPKASDFQPAPSVKPAPPIEATQSNHSSQQRMPLDTAQLSAHELPDRGITKTGRNDRKRKKVPWD